MLKFPGNLTGEQFLRDYWQKRPLFMPRALASLRPSISRNELAWLATLDDVESRLVFLNRDSGSTKYRVETGPFDAEYLEVLPKRDWTLLVHDVEKHLPALRALFKYVPFIPDWRFDDLMVSFAAPGGGVGPHRDNYDVFLCQGIGTRAWRLSSADIGPDSSASSDLALLNEFEGGALHEMTAGDVLYLPPGVAHWGTAQRACMTYSIGMRAPQLLDLLPVGGTDNSTRNAFYIDADLVLDEVRPGYISTAAMSRAALLLERENGIEANIALGRFVTQTKQWLTPDTVPDDRIDYVIEDLRSVGRSLVHGMARIAYDDRMVYVNGTHRPLLPQFAAVIGITCERRELSSDQLRGLLSDSDGIELMRWMVQHGLFDLPEPR